MFVWCILIHFFIVFKNFSACGEEKMESFWEKIFIYEQY